MAGQTIDKSFKIAFKDSSSKSTDKVKLVVEGNSKDPTTNNKFTKVSNK